MLFRSRANLFEGAICAITPTSQSPPKLVTKLDELWKSVGAQPLRLSPELHDDLVGRSSHLPHVVAAELANYVLSPVHPKEQGMLCANGFRDTTRIASGSPEMWRDIALANREPLAGAIGAFIGELQQLQRAIAAGDAAALEVFYHTAKQRRDAWRSPSASSSPEIGRASCRERV